MFISHAFIPECCSLYLYLYVYHIDGMLAYFSGDVCKSEDYRIRMTGCIAMMATMATQWKMGIV